MNLMKEIEYVYFLSSTLLDRLRVRAKIEKDEVVGFSVQYEAALEKQWRPIVRYDTAHGFTHRDIIHPDGRIEKQPLFFPNLNIAFTFAVQDLKILWQWYRNSYEREEHND